MCSGSWRLGLARFYATGDDRAAGSLKIDLAPWPALQAFQARVAARPKVRETMKAEGLIKDPAPTATAA